MAESSPSSDVMGGFVSVRARQEGAWLPLLMALGGRNGAREEEGEESAVSYSYINISFLIVGGVKPLH